MPTCYMCEAESSSREHAPPQCIFPEKKDTLDDTDYRKNLIKVPSCDKHNSTKSHHDEYLLHVLAGSYTSSSVGLNQFMTKSARAFNKAPAKRSWFTQRPEPVRIKRVEDKDWEDGAVISVEGERLDLVLGNCARALYFHETAKKHTGPVQVITGFTMYFSPGMQEQIDIGLSNARTYFDDREKRGSNPEIFWYKFDEGAHTATLLMTFYSSSEVLVRLVKQ